MIKALNSLTQKKIFILEANPSAENMTKYLYDYVNTLYGDLVSKVVVWESPIQYAVATMPFHLVTISICS